MMIRHFFALCLNLFFIPCLANGILDVDFDQSTGIDLMKKYSVGYEETDANKKIDLLKQNYLRLIPSKIELSAEPIIPKVIHWVWLGKNSLPKNFLYYINTCKEYHPGWDFKIWTDEEIGKENLQNKDLVEIARSYAEQSDILRYEILYKYGGLYLDTDIQCFSSFEQLHFKYDFYTNLEPPAINKKRVTIGNNMIASVAGHPVLLETLKKIRQDWDKVESEFTKKFSNHKSSFARSNHNLAVHRTMYPFTDAIMDYLREDITKNHRFMVLPSSYNIPMYFLNDMPIINFLSKIFRNKGKLNNHVVIKPETLSFHFYDKDNSFLKEDFFANSLFNHSKLKGVIYMLLNLNDQYYLFFRKLFQTNAPYLVSYNVEPTIPKIIYLNNSSNFSDEQIKKLTEQWQSLNDNFTIISVKDDEMSKRVYRLYETGGAYIDTNFKPVSLKEFHYKFGFYSKFKKLNSLLERIAIDETIMGFAKGHDILKQMIRAFNKKDISYNAAKTFHNLFTDMIYKYHLFDGKSIVLPETYFDEKRIITQ